MKLENYVFSLFKHKRLYWVLFFCFFLGVIFRLPELEIWLLPKLTPMRYYVVTDYPHHSAEDTDLSVSVPISEMVSSVKSVKRIRTDSEHGKSVVQIDLEFGASNLEFKDQLYQTILEMKDRLPLGARAPRLLQGEMKERPFIEILIPKGDRKESDSFNFSLQQLVFQLERISGVTEVRIKGEPKHSSFISLKSHVLDVFPITVRDLESQIHAAIRGGSLGKIEGYTKDTELKFASQVKNHEDLFEFPIDLRDGYSVNLGQLATIFDSELPNEKLTRLDGRSSVYLALFTDPTANPLKISSEVRKKLQNLDLTLSPFIFFDASNELRIQLKQFVINLVWSLLFAFLFSYLLYRSWVPAFILLTSVVFSLLLFFHLVLFFSISINLLSLGGISVGIGMLFDASNLVVFSIRKKLENNIILNSVTKGIRSVLISLFSSSLTTIVVFIPLLVFPLEWNSFFYDSGICIALLVFCSFISSLWIVPLVIISFAESLKGADLNLTFESLLFLKYEKSYKIWEGLNKNKITLVICILALVSSIGFGFHWQVFPKQPNIGFSLLLAPKTTLSLTEELSVVHELQTEIQKINPNHPSLVVPREGFDPKKQNPNQAIPIEWKLLGLKKQKELESILSELLSTKKWDWKLEPIESQVAIALPFLPKDSIIFLHESAHELLKVTNQFNGIARELGFAGSLNFSPKQIIMEEWYRNQIPIPELILNEDDLMQRVLYKGNQLFLGTIGEANKRDLYIGIDSSNFDFVGIPDSKNIRFKTKTYESTFIGSLFTSKKKDSYTEYHRESGLFYNEWVGESLGIDSNLFKKEGGLSVVFESAKKEIRRFYLILILLFLLSFVYIYLTLVGIYESFLIPCFYLGISLLYLAVTVASIFILFREFHLGHYIGLIILLGLSIDSISLFGEKWMEFQKEDPNEKKIEDSFRWLILPIGLNSGTTLMGILPVILFGVPGSEFSQTIALTMFVGIPISVFFVFYIYPVLFQKYMEKNI
ncbi:efflux RND transporter permease subunit [Leptospira sp. 2 VSF19]|uniref:Efflux RND transporter permease subunit n=1 Tax=Leptospira soteropolitanensis TaxID=2950025 RepID=A0AAW5VK11_9LEPT|nr:efflux RND transporter permease subunit [Leptospira soteropolitanensis]MCW7493882.1 efflux RND transporter permease subunit [Leptospira soteropolitanensis]MCW7501476.1 efflux RND transporter permease subunit [Leptospira soteropolitanensis]MCW7523761.1 efflux RND transporter permease subunit [Leptospira soteropolitanensis]MCW7527625.1 efflux RND transporter permease subunit [Leptospira soteropolitanensis]MCW7531479.1 efflux RND transporter permease subunit [Leptospira soteropolitanensis]